jgi:hypothetical protein
MPTFTQIGTAVTVGSGGAASIDFSSIPSTYTDLVLRLSLRQDSGTLNYASMRFNNATTNFTYRTIEGAGSGTPGSFNGSTGTYGFPVPSPATASTFSSADIYIPNYAGSTNKSFSVDTVTENNATTAYADLIAGLWSQTTAINQVTFYPAGGNFVQYSTAYLYGVSNA